jgi:hypothetical protein
MQFTFMHVMHFALLLSSHLFALRAAHISVLRCSPHICTYVFQDSIRQIQLLYFCTSDAAHISALYMQPKILHVRSANISALQMQHSFLHDRCISHFYTSDTAKNCCMSNAALLLAWQMLQPIFLHVRPQKFCYEMFKTKKVLPHTSPTENIQNMQRIDDFYNLQTWCRARHFSSPQRDSNSSLIENYR